MKVRVKGHLSSNELRMLGYRLSVIDSGYVSSDGATIIYLFRKPENGLVEQHWNSKDIEAHKRNVQELRDGGFLEE